MSVFKEYSIYYDLLYKDKDYQAEVDYVHNLIQKYNPGAKTILDLGCGTGIHANLLAGLGYQVKGIDFSDEMVSVANQKLDNEYENHSQSLSFEIGNACSIRLNQQFDVVISLFHVASYQTSNQEILSMFETILNHQKEGGISIIDFWYGPGVLNDPPSVRVKRLSNNEFSILRIAEPESHPNENVVDVNYEIQIENKLSQVTTILKEKHPMRYFFNPELDLICEKVGLSRIDIMEWLSYSKPNLSSWTACMVMK
jgi:SAM-dependent methyltransferase